MGLMEFRDRSEAGRLLGRRLAELGLDQPVVLGLTRGGVPVAAEVATALGAPLDALVVRKLGYPPQPELGVGAVAEADSVVLDGPLIARLGLSDEETDRLVHKETAELERQVARYHGDRPRLALGARVVVVVDDGLATGFTARAAVEACRRAGAARVVLAVPVGAAESVRALRSVADEVVCLSTSADFFAVGQFYRDFAPVSDDDVQALLQASRGVGAGAGGAGARAAMAADPSVEIPVGFLRVQGDLLVPDGALGVVVFAHGSGSSRLSPRNRAVASSLNGAGLATLLFDLLTDTEASDRRLVFDIGLLAGRLEAAVDWVGKQPLVSGLPIGLFGASTGAAAALVAAADLGERVRAVVSRGGRPDLADVRLSEVTAPTLLIVGGLDDVVLDLNRDAQRQLPCKNTLEVVPGATHLFEEPGTLEAVARLTAQWFVSAFQPAHVTR